MLGSIDSQFDPSSSFSWVFDAIHGAISIEDASPGMGHTIKKLLSSPVVERLRRIKQLPFAPQSYLSGDHSRYAHSLGTMQVTRLILNHLQRIEGLTPELYESLHNYCPDIFSGESERDYPLLLQHMLVAALLQDVGELPFGPSTKFIFEPDIECVQRARNFAGFDVINWSSKQLFTIACLTEVSIASALEGLNRSLLVFLITGYPHPNLKFGRNMVQLHNILDSIIDADRIDYVFRDAHHTVGGVGTPNALIDSLLYFDEQGVVVRDPGPVSIFLADRGHLYATVYLAPTSRFRTVLMTTFLRSMIIDEYHGKHFFGNTNQGKLSTEEFIALDDVSLTQKLQEYGRSSHRKRIVGKSAIALKLLSGDTSIYDYEFSWLPFPQNQLSLATNKLILPDQLFYDTFTNANSSLYEKGSVRVKNTMFKHVGNLVPLEDCGGPFTAILKEERSSVLPMRNSILLYTPLKRPEGTWIQYSEALNNGSLYTLLLENDPFNPFTYPLDTRRMQNFRPGNLFISYTGVDKQMVKRIVECLYKMKCRYYLYLGDFQGLGTSPSWNSTNAVTIADAVLLVASKNYARRYKDAPDGNVAREWREMCRRASLENLAVAVVPLDNVSEIDLPWAELSLNEPPFSGLKSLRSTSTIEMEETIENIIDELFLGKLVRHFATMGSHENLICMKLLEELAHCGDGFLSLPALRVRRPDLASSIEQFLSEKWMDKFYTQYPDGINHLFFDPSVQALVARDPQLTFYLNEMDFPALARAVGKVIELAEPHRPKVFISYSHKDTKWLERLQVHLKPLEQRGIIDLWDDSKIEVGARWKEEIQSAIKSATIAVLLVSADFLASHFISKYELPKLLSSAETEGTTILPVVVAPCFFNGSAMDMFQSVNPPDKPLSEMTPSGRERTLVKLAEVISKNLSRKS